MLSAGDGQTGYLSLLADLYHTDPVAQLLDEAYREQTTTTLRVRFSDEDSVEIGCVRVVGRVETYDESGDVWVEYSLVTCS